MRYLVTGTAGFIGFHLASQLLAGGHEVIGLDNYNPYYAPILKEARNRLLQEYDRFSSIKLDIADLPAVEACFHQYQPQIVCHLAAQAGVRYSLRNPFVYQKSNLEGFVNILELSRQYRVERLVYASSSSVYGCVKEVPYREDQAVDTPISLYAATKRANELLAYSYSHLYSLQTIGLRYFTVYGPWGRPDMALWKFTDSIEQGRSIDVYNQGEMWRDFTYVSDIVAGTIAALQKEGLPRYEIINLGNHHPEKLTRLIALLEAALEKNAVVRLLPLQAGDMVSTYADIGKAQKLLGFEPTTTLENGVREFVSWFRSHSELMARVRNADCLG